MRATRRQRSRSAVTLTHRGRLAHAHRLRDQLWQRSTATVSAFDDRTCNATDQAGCAAVATLKSPGGNASTSL